MPALFEAFLMGGDGWGGTNIEILWCLIIYELIPFFFSGGQGYLQVSVLLAGKLHEILRSFDTIPIVKKYQRLIEDRLRENSCKSAWSLELYG